MAHESCTPLILDTRRSEIEKLVGDDELNRATTRLMDYVRDFSQDRSRIREVTALRGEFSGWKKDVRQSGKTPEIRQQAALLRTHILELLDVVTEKLQEQLNRSDPQSATPIRPISASISPEEEWTSPEHPTGNTQGAIETHDAPATGPPEKAISSDAIIFEGRGLTQSFQTRSITFALKPIDVILKQGEITALVGENGSGKTTLLEIIAGLVKGKNGYLTYPGLTSDRKDWYSIKRQTGYIAQDLSGWYGLLADRLHFAASMQGIRGDENEEEVKFIIYRLGLEAYRNAKWEQISGGYRTRFELARVLVRKPKLLVLDEPLANLDVNTQILFLEDLRDLVRSVAHPMAVLVSSQHLHEVESVADNVIFLKGGEALYNGSVEDFGEDRDENCFEILSDISKADLMEILETVAYKRIETAGDHYIIYTAREVSTIDFLNIFVEKGISLKLFRDISKSTRKLFSLES